MILRKDKNEEGVSKTTRRETLVLRKSNNKLKIYFGLKNKGAKYQLT
jgi:hypothetical protein